MTVRVYKQGDDMEVISEVREPNAAQHHDGNSFKVYKDGLFGPFSLYINNDEVSISITHTSTQKLINKMLSDSDLIFEIMQRLYLKESCKRMWRGWEENNGN